MKYFKLEYNSLNIEETGTQFQSITGDIGDMHSNFLPFEGKILTDFKLPVIHLQNNAKQTTLLNSVIIQPWFLIFRNNFIKYLKEYNISEFQCWNIDITHNKEIIRDYSLFYLIKGIQDTIVDYKNSEFFIGNFNKSKDNTSGKNVGINNYYEYLKIKSFTDNDDNLFLYCNKVVINLKNIEFDLFRLINIPFGGYFVSERLKNAIEQNRFTGMRFQEIEEFNSNIKVIY